MVRDLGNTRLPWGPTCGRPDEAGLAELPKNVAIVMHDLKSPVTTVRSLARLGKSSKEQVV